MAGEGRWMRLRTFPPGLCGRGGGRPIGYRDSIRGAGCLEGLRTDVRGRGFGICEAAAVDVEAAGTWGRKWRGDERNSLPLRRLAIHRELARRGAFARWPIQGEVLELLRAGRLEVGEGTLFEPNVWLTAPDPARIRIGAGSFLNMGVLVAAVGLGEIGDHCMFANGFFVTDGAHRFDDPDKPVPWQGFTTKGPTRIGDNVWCGANVVVTSGVTIGERAGIGAKSGVTSDIPPQTTTPGGAAR